MISELFQNPENLVARLAESVAITDLEGKLLYANENVPIFNILSDVGQNLFALVDSDCVHSLQSKFDIASLEGLTSICLFQHFDKYVKAKFVPIIEDGHLAKILATFDRITIEADIDLSEPISSPEDNLLNREIIQTQKMNSIGRLAGGIAHDYKNYLNAITGNAELLLMKLTTIDPSVKSCIDSIFNACDSSLALSNQLMTFARSEPANISQINLNDIINKSLDFSKVLFKNGINVELNLAEGLEKVPANAGQFNQVFTNLVINAVDAMPNGGTLLISSENFISDESMPQLKSEKYVKIVVSDTGEGMSSKVLERIYEPFFTTKGKNEVGLGLSTVYTILKNHKGWISADSEVGKGSQFTLYFNVDFVSTRSAINKKVVQGGNILIIDDDDDIVEIISESLKLKGFNVDSAENGEKGVEFFKNNTDKIDIILLDFMMPGLNGYETYLKLRKVKHDVKVLVLSSFSNNGQVLQLVQSGCLGYIKKPFIFSDVVAKINDAINA